MNRIPQDNECLGYPEGFTGGDIEWCCAPTKPGRRFCDRCHRARELSLLRRIEQLQAQVENERTLLQQLMAEKQS